MSESPDDVALRLQQRYDAILSITFAFNQDTRGEMTGRPRRGSGTGLFYRNNGKNYMRWDYSSPEKQVLLSNGKNFFMYFSNLQQMIVSPVENYDADLTYSFFTGRGNLQRDFHIRPADEELQSSIEDDFQVIKLIPKAARSQVQDIHIWVTSDSLIRRIRIRDHFGTITVLNLSDIEVNTLVNLPEQELESLFSFTPPEGTEIINQ
jgi:outer membrane lipoprotein carrier protein